MPSQVLYNDGMHQHVSSAEIPSRLRPHFQEYDLAQLDLSRDANLVIQRVLEFGTWEEIRWLFELYGVKRIRSYVRQHGERGLGAVSFNYWLKLLRIRRWVASPLPTPKGELWNR